jgi:hypothetical protein
LVLEFAASDADTFSFHIKNTDTVTVLQLLANITNHHQIGLQSREFAFGTMVTRIGNQENGSGGYWLYQVNNEAIPEAASACALTGGDTVRFFFANQ